MRVEIGIGIGLLSNIICDIKYGQKVAKQNQENKNSD